MKKYILSIILLIIGCIPSYAQFQSNWFGGGGGNGTMPTGTSLPATCNNGNNFLLTTAASGQNIYSCIAGAWVQQGLSGSGGGTVTTASVVSANGLAGTVANPTTSPAITLSTTITGVLKGNGTAISAATSGTDYAPATTGSSILKASSGGFANAISGTDYAPATTGSSILKASSGGFANATSGTDYAPATSGSAILKGNGSGGFTNTTSGTDYAPATTGSSILKASSGGFANAVSGTDYAPATSGSAILKGNGSGGFSNTTSGTDYAPATSGSSILKGNGSGGFSNTTAGTDYAAATTGTSTQMLANNGSGGFSNVTVGSGLSLSGGSLTATGAGSVSSIATTGPITGGTITSTGTIGISQATGSTSGYLSNSDWNTFNGKQANLSLTPGSYTNGGLCFYNTGGVFNCTASANGTGSVTTVSVVTANGISGSVANPTTTPAITLNPDLYSSGINWQDINLFKTITTGINWQALPQIVQTYNINWNDVNRIANLNSTGINWASINSLATINAGGLNWQNINLAGMLNMSGINWADARNQITGINWYQANLTTKTLSTAGAGVGNLKLYDSSGINWSDIQAASTINAPYTWTWPSADGTNGQVLTTNGSGTLSFSAAGSGAGTVNSGTQYQMSYYAANGTAVSGNSNIITNSSGWLGVDSSLGGSENLQVQSTSSSAPAYALGIYDATYGLELEIGGIAGPITFFNTGISSNDVNWIADRFGGSNNKIYFGDDGTNSYIQTVHNLVLSGNNGGTLPAINTLTLTSSGGLTLANASSHAGQATCWTTSGAIGYCTSVVGAGGACTCTGL